MRLENGGSQDDRLLSAASDAAMRAELHTHIQDGYAVKMRPVGSIDLPVGASTQLKPGGLHVMLMGLKAPLKQGESFPLTLSFEKAGSITIEVTIEAVGAMRPSS